MVPILVGFTTQPRDDAQAFIPKFDAPPSITDPEERDRYSEKKRAQFMLDIANTPYFGELEYVYLAIPAASGAYKYLYAEIPAEHNASTKTLTQVIADALAEWFPQNKAHDIRYVGFDTHTFAHLFGTRMAEETASNGTPPVSQKFGILAGEDDIDVRDIVTPFMSCHDRVSLDIVIERFATSMPEAMSYEPGMDPKLDACIAASMMARMNVFPEYTAFFKQVSQDLLDELCGTGEPSLAEEAVKRLDSAIEELNSLDEAETPVEEKPKAKGKKGKTKASRKPTAQAKPTKSKKRAKTKA